MICPDTHKHGATTTCYHRHGCKCDNCSAAVSTRQRARRKNIAYGRHEPMVDVLGVQRRIQGLQVLGWRYSDIGEVMGVTAKRVHSIAQRTDRVTPRVYTLVLEATRVLVARGVGPSESTAARAKAAGWVSLFVWDDVDGDASPEKTERERSRHGVDEVAVEQAMNGYGGERLNTAEADEAIERLHARQWSDALIAATIRRSEKTVLLTRQRLGLEAWPTADLVKLRERKAA